jgi:hypothetical protein
VPEDAPYTFSLSDFPTDVAISEQLDAVKLISFSGVGLLTLRNTPVPPGALISPLDIATGQLRYTPPANSWGTSMARIAFHTISYGVPCFPEGYPTPFTFTLNVTPVNDSPSGANRSIITPQFVPYVFQPTEFGFSDPQDVPSHALQAVKIVTGPLFGNLTVADVRVAPGQFVHAGDIAAGRLQYLAGPDLQDQATWFTFQVQDTGGTVNGGSNLDSTPRTVSITVIPANQPPSFVPGPNVKATDENGSQIFPAWATSIHAGFGDPGVGHPNGQSVAFQVLSISNAGLFLTPPAISPSGTLSFAPAPNVRGVAEISIQLKDDGGTADGGIDTSPVQTFEIEITKPRAWHNTALALDVTAEGQITPRDVLAVVNYLNAFGQGPVPSPTGVGPPFYDTASFSGQPIGDNFVTTLDALIIINHLNSNSSGEDAPTGESSGVDDAVVEILAQDLTSRPKRKIVSLTLLSP